MDNQDMKPEYADSQKADSKGIPEPVTYIFSNTREGFTDGLNKVIKDGYNPVWDMYNIHSSDNFFVICEYQEPIDTTESDEIKAELSQKIMEAEFQAAKANSDLTEQTDKLRLETNWDELNEERVKKNLAKITNKEGREAYINKQTKKATEWVGTTKRWLAHVKRLERIGVLPEDAPWEKLEDPKPEDEKAETEFKKLELDPEVEKYLEENGEVKE